MLDQNGFDIELTWKRHGEPPEFAVGKSNGLTHQDAPRLRPQDIGIRCSELDNYTLQLRDHCYFVIDPEFVNSRDGSESPPPVFSHRCIVANAGTKERAMTDSKWELIAVVFASTAGFFSAWHVIELFLR